MLQKATFSNRKSIAPRRLFALAVSFLSTVTGLSIGAAADGALAHVRTAQTALMPSWVLSAPSTDPEANRSGLRHQAECYPAARELPASAVNLSHIGRVPLAPGLDRFGADVEIDAKPDRPILVYQATGGGFRVLDVTDPRLVCVIGRGVSEQPAPGPAFFQRIALHKNLLALASQNNSSHQGFEGVELFDISDPASPRLCDSQRLPVGAHSVEFDPHLEVVYATTSKNFPAGLYVLGLSPSPQSGCKNLELAARYLNPIEADGVPPCAAMESSSPCELIDPQWRPHDIYVPEEDEALRYVAASHATYLVDMSSFPECGFFGRFVNRMNQYGLSLIEK